MHAGLLETWQPGKPTASHSSKAFRCNSFDERADETENFESVAPILIMFGRTAKVLSLPLVPASLFCFQKAYCIRSEDAVGQRKLSVGYKSVDDHVESNSIVGIGTGTTAHHAMERSVA
jgi:hypothetical protein